MTRKAGTSARPSAERVNEALEAIGARTTQPRQEIAERLIDLGDSGKAFTADGLFADLRASGSSVGRATVYRTIEKLVKSGLIDRVDFADGERWYRLCVSEAHHHHLTCRSCHRVVEIDICLPAGRLAEIGESQHFTIEDHEITLFGICDECRRAEARAKPQRSREKSADE